MSDYFIHQNDVLENKLGIRDAELLKQAEASIVPLRIAEVLSDFKPAKFDFDCLLFIHKKLFSDIYYIAGKVRTVDVAKGASAFCYVQYIEDEQKRIFSELQHKAYLQGLNRDNFIRELSALSSDLNALHPFREGNGRAIRCFLTLLAKSCGFDLVYSKVSTEELLHADIAAFNGDLACLENLYRQIVY